MPDPKPAIKPNPSTPQKTLTTVTILTTSVRASLAYLTITAIISTGLMLGFLSAYGGVIFNQDFQIAVVSSGSCSGTPVACSSWSEAQCLNHSGCSSQHEDSGYCNDAGICYAVYGDFDFEGCISDERCAWNDGECGENGNYCPERTDENSCIADNCAWTTSGQIFVGCSGTPSACNTYQTQTPCDLNDDCVWTPSVSTGSTNANTSLGFQGILTVTVRDNKNNSLLAAVKVFRPNGPISTSNTDPITGQTIFLLPVATDYVVQARLSGYLPDPSQKDGVIIDADVTNDLPLVFQLTPTQLAPTPIQLAPTPIQLAPTTQVAPASLAVPAGLLVNGVQATSAVWPNHFGYLRPGSTMTFTLFGNNLASTTPVYVDGKLINNLVKIKVIRPTEIDVTFTVNSDFYKLFPGSQFQYGNDGYYIEDSAGNLIKKYAYSQYSGKHTFSFGSTKTQANSGKDFSLAALGFGGPGPGDVVDDGFCDDPVQVEIKSSTKDCSGVDYATSYIVDYYDQAQVGVSDEPAGIVCLYLGRKKVTEQRACLEGIGYPKTPYLLQHEEVTNRSILLDLAKYGFRVCAAAASIQGRSDISWGCTLVGYALKILVPSNELKTKTSQSPALCTSSHGSWPYVTSAKYSEEGTLITYEVTGTTKPDGSLDPKSLKVKPNRQKIET